MKHLKNIKNIKAFRIVDLKNSEGPDAVGKVIAIIAGEGGAQDFVATAAERRFERQKNTGGNLSLDAVIGTFRIEKAMAVQDSRYDLYLAERSATISAEQAQPRSLGSKLRYLARKAYYSVAA